MGRALHPYAAYGSMACPSFGFEDGPKLVVERDVTPVVGGVVVQLDATMGDVKASFNDDYCVVDNSYSSGDLGDAAVGSVDCAPGIARNLG